MQTLSYTHSSIIFWRPSTIIFLIIFLTCIDNRSESLLRVCWTNQECLKNGFCSLPMNNFANSALSVGSLFSATWVMWLEQLMLLLTWILCNGAPNTASNTIHIGIHNFSPYFIIHFVDDSELQNWTWNHSIFWNLKIICYAATISYNYRVAKFDLGATVNAKHLPKYNCTNKAHVNDAHKWFHRAYEQKHPTNFNITFRRKERS